MGNRYKGVKRYSLPLKALGLLDTIIALIPLVALIKKLFGAGQQGVFYIPEPIVRGKQALFQSATGATSVTEDNDPVGRMLDKSGNGLHATQTVTAERMLYDSPRGLLQDQVDDTIAISGLDLVPTTGVKTWTLCAGYSDLGNASIMFLNQDNNDYPWIGIGEAGSSSTQFSPAGIVQELIWFNGILEYPANRDEMFTLMAASGVLVIEFTVSESVAVWNRPSIGRWPKGGFYGPKKFEFYMLREGSLTDSERNDIEAYAAESAGITL